MPELRVRESEASDLEAVIAVWHETKQDAYPYLPLEQGRTLDEDRGFFLGHIAARCTILIAELDTTLIGFAALDGSYLDRLYIHPSAQRSGAGSALLARARQLSPAGIELHTHQENASARAFYEKHGFAVFRFGISPPPESAPDIEYHWRPNGTR
jgi:ribosomal protein S18 acetylase RimI-like enzyme